MVFVNCSKNCSYYELKLLEDEYLDIYGIYGIVLLGLCIGVGIFGNAHVLAIYPDVYRKSTFTVFVVFLACVDLFSSVLCIPLHIVDMRYRYTFMSAEFCKFIRFVTYSSSGASGMLLGVIAFERFRKICRPLKKQMSKVVITRVCVGIILLAFLICSPTLDFYGVKDTDVIGYPGVLGKACGPVKSSYNTIFFGCLLFIGTVIVILTTIFYILIIKTVWRQRKYMSNVARNSTASNRATLTSEITNSNTLNVNGHLGKDPIPDEKFSDNNYTTETSTSDNEPSFSLENKRSSQAGSVVTRHKRKKANSMKRAIGSAFMFLVTSIVSYFGFLPILIFSIIRAIDSSIYDEIEAKTGTMMDIMLRAYFFNSIVNPIIYCFMDAKFRHEIKLRYTRVCCHNCK